MSTPYFVPPFILMGHAYLTRCQETFDTETRLCRHHTNL